MLLLATTMWRRRQKQLNEGETKNKFSSAASCLMKCQKKKGKTQRRNNVGFGFFFVYFPSEFTQPFSLSHSWIFVSIINFPQANTLSSFIYSICVAFLFELIFFSSLLIFHSLRNSSALERLNLCSQRIPMWNESMQLIFLRAFLAPAISFWFSLALCFVRVQLKWLCECTTLDIQTKSESRSRCKSRFYDTHTIHEISAASERFIWLCNHLNATGNRTRGFLVSHLWSMVSLLVSPLQPEWKLIFRVPFSFFFYFCRSPLHTHRPTHNQTQSKVKLFTFVQFFFLFFRRLFVSTNPAFATLFEQTK